MLLVLFIVKYHNLKDERAYVMLIVEVFKLFYVRLCLVSLPLCMAMWLRL